MRTDQLGSYALRLVIVVGVVLVCAHCDKGYTLLDGHTDTGLDWDTDTGTDGFRPDPAEPGSEVPDMPVDHYTDGDTISDVGEDRHDPDGPVDTDGDTILDIHEGDSDMDGDGTPNYLDNDSDGDTIPDSTEAGDSSPMTFPVDSDGDTIPDFLDLDSDNDTISDLHEGNGDADGNGVPNYLDTDSDGDTIPDSDEAGDSDLLTPPVDSDGDTIPDFLDSD